MAYSSKGLSVLAYANGFTLWHYTTQDTAAVLDSSGYFNDADNMLRAGDMVLVNTQTATTPAAGIVVVATSAGGVVDVKDMTNFGAVNTD